MGNEKVIAVLGSTGSQGGGLCHSLFDHPTKGEFACRAITRDPTKAKAQELKSKGAEIVRADIDDVASLAEAFDGAHGVFAVTNFWEHQSAEREKQQALNIAIAAEQASVKHVLWSTLEDTRQFMSPSDTRMPLLQGNYRVPHLDCKNESNKYFNDLPTTYLITSFFWENMFNVTIHYNPIDADTFRTFPIPGAEEIGNNFQYFRDFNDEFLQFRSVELMNELNPNPQTFAEFVSAHRDQIWDAMNS